MNGMPAATDGDEALLVTADGYRQLRSELGMLQSDARTEMSERLREARQDGRLADNPALFELLEDQAQLEQQIAILKGQVAAAQIVAPVTNGRAEIGSCVRVRDLAVGEVAEYELGGLIESDLGKGRVSVGAPVGARLLVALPARSSKSKPHGEPSCSRSSMFERSAALPRCRGGPHEAHQRDPRCASA
jgi:transcription elongation factor GreA